MVKIVFGKENFSWQLKILRKEIEIYFEVMKVTSKNWKNREYH